MLWHRGSHTLSPTGHLANVFIATDAAGIVVTEATRPPPRAAGRGLEPVPRLRSILEHGAAPQSILKPRGQTAGFHGPCLYPSAAERGGFSRSATSDNADAKEGLAEVGRGLGDRPAPTCRARVRRTRMGVAANCLETRTF